MDKLYLDSIQNRTGYWEARASELEWFKKWDRVYTECDYPFVKWFDGGKFNIVQNAIDRHLLTPRKNKLALIWENEKGQSRVFSYHCLYREVAQFASILKSMGVKKGEVVTLYMPQIPELIIAMLACARIGAIHSVVYGGFSAEALSSRMLDANSRLLVTADGGFRRGKIIDLRKIAHEAIRRTPSIEISITVKYTGHEVPMESGRDFWWHELRQLPSARQLASIEVMDAEDPLFILYTSGTTGKPKGLVHTHAGYAVYTSTTHKAVFDLQDTDRYWCTADPGWITGHSYLVYGPLINGATVFSYEGAPDYPYPDRYWSLIEKYGITQFYTSPTAIRGLMRFGDDWPKRHDLSSLRILGSVGEPINPEAWRWYYTHIGGERCPIMDTWWQTETGGFVITPLPGRKLKPGSATLPFYGQSVAIVDENGNEVPRGQEGNLVIQNSWPGIARTIWKDPERYVETYFKAYEKQRWYKTGDSARMDEDGYVWIIGRVDEVIKVSGYRLGTAEIESALVSHPAVAEAAAIGIPHELKGNAIHCFVVLRQNYASSKELLDQLKEHVANELGPIARPEAVCVVEALPKTRSGKIMRRVLKARALGLDEGDVSTLEE
jgi:acetyl-CoA synthetase